MLQGRFGDTSRRPYMSARVIVPRLNVTGNVSFIFDTGADFTMLMPADAATMSIDYNELNDPSSSFGIGGAAEAYVEPANIVFVNRDGDRLFGYNIQLYIQDPTPSAMHIPSLLGRDIIDRLRVTYDKSANKLLADVVSCDVDITLK